MFVLILTALRWWVVGVFDQSFALQFLAQTIHAFSFGLFHMIAMRIIFQNFHYTAPCGAWGLQQGVFWQGVIGICLVAN